MDDLRHLRADKALRELLSLGEVPQADSAGDWLRRLGQQGVFRTMPAGALSSCVSITHLRIDAAA